MNLFCVHGQGLHCQFKFEKVVNIIVLTCGLFTCIITITGFVCMHSFAGKLRGLNESSGKLDIPANLTSEEVVCSKVKEAAAVTYIGVTSTPEGASTYRFAARTISGGTHVLVTVKVPADGQGSSITVNCEKMAISSMLVKEIKQVLQ